MALSLLGHVIAHYPRSPLRRRPQGIRYAHGIHESAYRESVLIRSAAEAKIREADRLECEAWNAIMWAGGPAMPSPGDPQAEPTIGKAINGWFDLLEAKCNRCDGSRWFRFRSVGIRRSGLSGRNRRTGAAPLSDRSAQSLWYSIRSSSFALSILALRAAERFLPARFS